MCIGYQYDSQMLKNLPDNVFGPRLKKDYTNKTQGWLFTGEINCIISFWLSWGPQARNSSKWC